MIPGGYFVNMKDVTRDIPKSDFQQTYLTINRCQILGSQVSTNCACERGHRKLNAKVPGPGSVSKLKLGQAATKTPGMGCPTQSRCSKNEWIRENVNLLTSQNTEFFNLFLFFTLALP